MKERRRDTRAIAFFRTEVHYKKKIYVGYIVNISTTGCAFAHENLTQVEEMANVRAKFRLDGKLINVAGIVRWRDATIMGLQFVRLTDTAKKQLREYIRAVTMRRMPL
ncbi:MAG: hypothetical protein A3G34_16075 [Candidatus Lindowbacteria bacterium RIFCSPLOWO2_12_FULL_62_27]|nr:MAG: hypothetical protein A3I06_12385 [Candidatus Lindowbacteria bacterium RIFCSPLOWO2_02_FULL_62_12]OGH61141.1 MAG: hypothetical protein A3G34_16075 [Candidatus Lindowbacteria bacterium RIFCSPLOWO2_12_FULL_62_27]